MKEHLYNYEFYKENWKNRHQYDALGDAIAGVLGARGQTVCDVGSGCGLLLARLMELGFYVRGFEGSEVGIEMTPELVRDKVSNRNLEDGELLPEIEKWKNVICIEVAEHLPEEAAFGLVEQINHIARDTVIWSAAPPGQGGVDHVNEQEPKYWLVKFSKLGLIENKVRTNALRNLMIVYKAQHYTANQNFYVLERV